MGLTNHRLYETNGFRQGQSVRARQLDAIQSGVKQALSISVSEPGTHIVVDRDGIHRRVVPIPQKATLEVFWAVVIKSMPNSGYVLARTATGRLGSLYPADPLEVPFKVWVGYETHLRGNMVTQYDEIYCLPNPDTVNNTDYPYFGFCMMPGFAHAEPTSGYAPDQDDATVIADDTP